MYFVNDINLLGVMMFALLSAVFWLSGHRLLVFVAAFTGLLACFFFLSRLLGANLTADATLTAAGFIFYFGGLLIVRTIIRRSISLHLLLKLDSENPLESMKSEIKDRLSDMRRYRLAVEKDEGLHLTGWGMFVAGVTSLFYGIFGQK